MNKEKLLQLCEETAVLKQLESRGYIERKGTEVIFTKKAEQLLKKEVVLITATSDNIEDFVNEYRNLFPRGEISGGYPVRGDKRGCIERMQKFLKLYPDYSREVILEATRNYINRKEKEGFRYMQLAHYFILKDKISNLAGECEMILDNNLNSDRNESFEEQM